MNTDEYIDAKKDELKKWENELTKRGHELTGALQTKRDEVMKKLAALKSETGDRLDVVRMGFESAWNELKTTFETVTSKDLNGKS